MKSNMFYPECKKDVKYAHLHDSAHGLPETHISGSERYECAICGYKMKKEEAEKQGLIFFIG